MAVREILLLGNPKLHRRCAAVERNEVAALSEVFVDLHDTLIDFRHRHGAGRAIAAPQIGVLKRIVYVHVGEPVVFINPDLQPIGKGTFELWDDCMSFPDLLVRVRRYRSCRVRYIDREWRVHEKVFKDDLSELMQHECDHLDGILAVSRAVDGESFALRSEMPLPNRESPAGSLERE